MASYNIRLSTVYDIKKWRDQLQLFVASRESVKDLFNLLAMDFFFQILAHPVFKM